MAFFLPIEIVGIMEDSVGVFAQYFLRRQFVGKKDNTTKTKNPMPVKRKVILIIAIVLAVIIVLLLSAYGIYSHLNEGSADVYTLEEHTERISKLVEKRYFAEGSEYTGYELFPIYDENDELRYFLIELQPVGFVYVRLNKYYSKITSPAGMYTRCEGEPWRRYRIWTQGVVNDTNGNYIENLPYPGGGWRNNEKSAYHQVYYEVDENDEFVVQKCSHFKAANIVDEKRYILLYHDAYIPAIKKDGQYFNLVSMEKLHGTGCRMIIDFIPKGSFNL